MAKGATAPRPRTERKKKYRRKRPTAEPAPDYNCMWMMKYIPAPYLVMPPSSDAQLHCQGEIYCITNRLTGRRYVGQTKCMKWKNGVEVYLGYLYRFEQHMVSAFSNDSDKKQSCPRFYESVRTFGPQFYYVELLERCATVDMNTRERYYIKILKTRSTGYNITAGGQFKRKRRRKA